MEARSARPVVPGRRGRVRLAAVAKGRESRSRRGEMQSASHTPSSHSRRAVRSPRAPCGRTAWRSGGPERDEPGRNRLSPLRESRRRGIDPPGITSANATRLPEHHSQPSRARPPCGVLPPSTATSRGGSLVPPSQ
jgi:hypothetical protein